MRSRNPVADTDQIGNAAGYAALKAQIESKRTVELTLQCARASIRLSLDRFQDKASKHSFQTEYRALDCSVSVTMTDLLGGFHSEVQIPVPFVDIKLGASKIVLSFGPKDQSEVKSKAEAETRFRVAIEEFNTLFPSLAEFVYRQEGIGFRFPIRRFVVFDCN